MRGCLFLYITYTMKFTPISEIGTKKLQSKLSTFVGANTLFESDKYTVESLGSKFSSNHRLIQHSLTFVEGIHFDITYTPFEHLGYKAISLLSNDFYAQMGQIISIGCNLSIPNRVSVEMIESLVAGLNQGCVDNGCALVEKNVQSNAQRIIISIYGLGLTEMPSKKVKDQVSEGDAICLSGDVGAAIAGLRILMREKKYWQEQGEGNFQPDLGDYTYVVQRQLMPKSRKDLVELFEKEHISPTTVRHLNGGVLNEVASLCEDCGLGAHIYQATLPIAVETRQVADEMEEDVDKYAYFGGEDSELLFTLPEVEADRLFKLFKDFTVIGRMTDSKSSLVIQTAEGDILSYDDMKV